jgi:hypothetical protein
MVMRKLALVLPLLLIAGTVHAAGLLTGQTPASYSLPSGWSLVKAQGFESGCSGDENCTQRGASIGTTRAHSGTHSLQGTYAKDSDEVGWVLNGSEGSFAEIYISWYDWTDSGALFNDEYFLARFWRESRDSSIQEVIPSFMFSGINQPTGMLQVMPQGIVSDNYGPFEAGTITYPVGQWVQWEVHYRPNTITGGSPNADGFFRIYQNGNLIRHIENVRLNGVSMDSMFVQIGGVYTKLAWTYLDPNVAGPSACAVPAQCAPSGNNNGCRNYMGWTITFANPQCGSSLPSFSRFIDDILIMTTGGATDPIDPPGNDISPPYVTGVFPVESGVGVPLTDDITFHVIDNRTDDTGVDNTTIKVTVAGVSERKSKSELLTYLQGLPAKSSKKVLSGQYIGALNEGPWGYEPYFDWLAIPSKNGGYYPAFLEAGAALQEFAEYCDGGPCPMNGLTSMIDHVKRGGIAGLSWHAVHPEDNKYGHIGDTTSLPDIYTSGHTEYDNFLIQLDNVAGILQQLEDEDITVLFRPFHEMNGDWFWWGTGSGTDADFITLWQYTHNYLTVTKGLSNLLWVYSPNSSVSGLYRQTDRYPGSSYVDFVGIDYYAGKSGRFNALSDYTAMKALGKPFVMGEIGQQTAAWSPYYARDVNTQITDIKANFPDTVWWNNWWGVWSMPGRLKKKTDQYGNWGLDQLFSDPWVIRREDLPSGHEFTCAAGLTCSGSAGDYTVTLNRAFAWEEDELVQVTVEATDVAGNTMPTKRYSFTTSSTPGALTITTASLPNATVGTAYSQTLAASGGSSPFVWDNTAVMPAGMSIPSSGTGSWGVPTTAGTYTIALRVTDELSDTDTESLSLVIDLLR